MSLSLIDDTGLPADGSMHLVRSLELRVADDPHPLEVAKAPSIAENWAREVAANPALFNGQTILQRQIRYHQGHISAEGHVSNFATFLWWRRQPGRGVRSPGQRGASSRARKASTCWMRSATRIVGQAPWPRS